MKKPALAVLVREVLRKVPWLYINLLKTGDTLRIRTVNRQPGKESQRIIYKVKVLNPKDGKAQLFIYRKRRKTEQVTGKILGSAISEKNIVAVNKGGIAVGFRIIFEADGFGKLKLFPTQEVWLNHKKVLPDFSKIKLKEK